MGDGIRNMVPVEDESKSNGKFKAKTSNSTSYASSKPSTSLEGSVPDARTSHLVTEMALMLNELKKMLMWLSQLGASFKSVEGT